MRRLEVVCGHFSSDSQVSAFPLPTSTSSHKMDSQVVTLSAHALDTSLGRPASGLPFTLSVNEGGENWRQISEHTTNHDGRAKPPNVDVGKVYRVRFDTKTYFDSKGIEKYFFPYVDVVFIPQNAEHYHIPLLLSPFGYTTYRGS
jgi:5-hydroxyisourate hydrolase